MGDIAARVEYGSQAAGVLVSVWPGGARAGAGRAVSHGPSCACACRGVSPGGGGEERQEEKVWVEVPLRPSGGDPCVRLQVSQRRPSGVPRRGRRERNGRG